jgi:glycogen operon protein
MCGGSVSGGNMETQRYLTSRGYCRKLGAQLSSDGSGTNFAVWCPNGTQLELVLFDSIDDLRPYVITLDPYENHTGYYWHVFVKGVHEGQLYGWRVTRVKSRDPRNVWNPAKVLLDPYSYRVVFPESYSRKNMCVSGSNIHCCPKSVVVNYDDFDWQDDRPLNVPLSRTVIYEMHVKGFTADYSCRDVPKERRGTYLGLIDKIPYLKSLGITAVELLPVFQFDQDLGFGSRTNYWGYDPIAFFAPHEGYSSDKSIRGPLDEFRTLVRELHRAGIEVYLDVVYNHTAEGGEGGPVMCFKGFDAGGYYLMDSRGSYMNFSGCGNTVNGSNPMTRRLIIDSLIFWSEVMHVDGFRFDLCSILSRNEHGDPVNNPPTLLQIDTDYRLADLQIIAEAWDAGGLYQVGRIPGQRWREWNGQFRDVVRRFVKGDQGQVADFLRRFTGSSDIYNPQLMDPQKSVNFITCHDGFTLWDLVSYNSKHNDLNGENNRDGSNDNFSWNHGTEGPTDKEDINRLRLRQVKNFMLVNLFAVGTPMILMGDEFLRTQFGNNNAYCQDNTISYFSWKSTPLREEMLRFTRELLHFRSEYFHRSNFDGDFRTLEDFLNSASFTWHGVRCYDPDMSPVSHSIGLEFWSVSANASFYMFFNFFWEKLQVELPRNRDSNLAKWYLLADTSREMPYDIVPNPELWEEEDDMFIMKPRSCVIMVSKRLPKVW